MNLFTKPMRLLTAVVLKTTSDKVSECLLRAGVMDFIDVKNLEDVDLESDGTRGIAGSFEPSRRTDSYRKNIDDLIRQLQGIYAQGMLSAPKMKSADITSNEDFSLDAAASQVEELNKVFLDEKEVQKAASMKLQSFQELDGYFREGKLSYIEIRVGKFSRDVQNLQGKLQGAVLCQFDLDQGAQALVTLRRDAVKSNPIIDKLGWIESDDPALQKKAHEIAASIVAAQTAGYQKDLNVQMEKVTSLIQENKGRMDELYKNLLVLRLCTKIKDYFQTTKNTAVFSGWVPADKSQQIESSIDDVTKGKCIIEWTDAADVKGVPVPVQMDAPKVLAPFTRIVNNYSTPEYGTINPVIFTTIAFLCMFGLMFADVGQGLVLLLIGIIGARAYKRDPMKKEGLFTNNLCHLMVFLGVSSMVFGVLFGSYFGFSWLPPVWFSYHHVVLGEGGNGIINNIYDILGVTIKFGFVVILTGLVLNWINLIRKKQWVPLVMDKYGILGGIIYVAGFWACTYFVKSGYKSFPPGNALYIFVGIPVVLLLFKGPLESIVLHEKFHLSLMDWLVDLLEVFSGYLSNTLSFMRVAGLGIAHVSLMNAFEMMADMTDNPVFYFLILAIGNVLVLAIEGLSAGIQALRLNYYEFFTKFFTGKGVAYKPVNIEE